MHCVNPSQTMIRERLKQVCAAYPKDKILPYLKEGKEQSQLAFEAFRDDLHLGQTLHIGCAVTRSNMVVYDVQHIVNTYFYNEAEELCIAVFNESYLNVSQLVEDSLKVHDDIILEYSN